MKIKTVKTLIGKKMTSWINSIKDDEVKKAIQSGAIVTGGSIVSMLLNETPNDFDVYFTNKEDLLKVVNYYNREIRAEVLLNTTILPAFDPERDNEDVYNGKHVAFLNTKEDQVKLWFGGNASYKKDWGKDIKEDIYNVSFASSNAISLTNQIQIITRFSGTPEKIHENFDFVHPMNYFVMKTQKLVLRQKSLESIISKTLIYQGSKYPLTSIIRAKKFILRGWKISAGQYLKMAWQISQLNLEDPRVLEEQLIGVDIAYFDQFISTMKDSIKEGSEIDYDYICKEIDYIFEGEEKDD